MSIRRQARVFCAVFIGAGTITWNMTPDGELLRRYAETSSEDAFAELVRRHVNLVYSTALRQVNGDAHLAEDVAQSVFTNLAREARALSQRNALTGWLYTTAWFTAAKTVRTERRRRKREQEAQTMRELSQEGPSDLDWNRLRPVLDDAMHSLNDADREAILLRFFENRRHGEIGARLGVTENTARMRVERALEKLRGQLLRRGWTTTAATLSTVISANAVQIAPTGLAATLTTASLAGAAAGTTTTLTALKLMSMTKLQLGVTALVIAGAATTLLLQHQSQATLREQNESLRQQLAQLGSDNETLSNRIAQMRPVPSPRLPAPALQSTASQAPAPMEAMQSTNLYGRVKDKSPKLTAGQVEPYLKANGRNAASLLAAYRTTGDPVLLAEAMQKYPNDPQVAFEAAFKPDATAEERHQWLEALKNSDPGNALPNYLSALGYFKAGQTDQAVQELITASGKQPFHDYSSERDQSDEEAYLAAGYSVAEAKTTAAMQLLLPQLKELKELSENLVNLSKSYQQAGDPASAQSALQLAANLGQRYGGSSPGEATISQLVGIAIERNALGAMDPTSAYGSSGQTVQDRLNQLSQQRATLYELAQQTETLAPTLSDQDWVVYKDRSKMFGEEAAERWLIGKYGKK